MAGIAFAVALVNTSSLDHARFHIWGNTYAQSRPRSSAAIVSLLNGIFEKKACRPLMSLDPKFGSQLDVSVALARISYRLCASSCHILMLSFIFPRALYDAGNSHCGISLKRFGRWSSNSQKSASRSGAAWKMRGPHKDVVDAVKHTLRIRHLYRSGITVHSSYPMSVSDNCVARFETIRRCISSNLAPLRPS